MAAVTNQSERLSTIVNQWWDARIREYYYRVTARYSAENPSEVRRIASVIRFVSSVEDILRIIENIILQYHLEASQVTTRDYKQLQVPQGTTYKGLKGTSYKGLHTRDYKGLEV